VRRSRAGRSERARFGGCRTQQRDVTFPYCRLVTTLLPRRDGTRIVTPSGDKTARVWSDLVPLRGTDDPRLWTATPYCLSIERRIALLNVSEATARADQAACQRRVEQARAAATGHD